VINMRRALGNFLAQRRRWEKLMRAAARTRCAASNFGSRPSHLKETINFGSNPGALRMFTYLPPRVPEECALVVVLHACTQSAASYDLGAGWSTLANRFGFALLLPEHQRCARCGYKRTPVDAGVPWANSPDFEGGWGARRKSTAPIHSATVGTRVGAEDEKTHLPDGAHTRPSNVGKRKKYPRRCDRRLRPFQYGATNHSAMTSTPTASASVATPSSAICTYTLMPSITPMAGPLFRGHEKNMGASVGARATPTTAF
jgi:hypothetical protein